MMKFELRKHFSVIKNIEENFLDFFGKVAQCRKNLRRGPLVSNSVGDTVDAMKNSKGVPFNILGTLNSHTLELIGGKSVKCRSCSVRSVV